MNVLFFSLNIFLPVWKKSDVKREGGAAALRPNNAVLAALVRGPLWS